MGFSDKVESMPFSQKLIVLVVTILLIGGGWYYFYYIDTAKKIESLQAEVNKLSKYKRELPSLKIKYKKALAEYAVYKNELPPKEEIPSLLVKLTNIIKSKNVALMSFTPKKAKPKDIYFIKPIDISLSATYKKCGLVFEDVSKMSRLFKVNNFSLTSPKIINSNKVLLNVKFSAETYYFKK
jgi:type IV pilus assembly protein PilO